MLAELSNAEVVVLDYIEINPGSPVEDIARRGLKDNEARARNILRDLECKGHVRRLGPLWYRVPR